MEIYIRRFYVEITLILIEFFFVFCSIIGMMDIILVIMFI